MSFVFEKMGLVYDAEPIAPTSAFVGEDTNPTRQQPDSLNPARHTTRRFLRVAPGVAPNQLL